MTSNWATDNAQNRALDELRDQMASVSSEASSLRFRLSQVQGSMETRLSRLTTAFDAFVELSDIRFDLIGYADAAEVRRRAGQVMSALASGETPPAAGADVPAYWLWPAVEAVRGLAGGGNLDESMLTEAMQRDERRTSLFLCLALASLGWRNSTGAVAGHRVRPTGRRRHRHPGAAGAMDHRCPWRARDRGAELDRRATEGAQYGRDPALGRPRIGARRQGQGQRPGVPGDRWVQQGPG